jgi:hypothetical protein
MKLTQAQVNAFHKHGVLVVPDLFTEDDLAPVIAGVSEFIERQAATLHSRGKIQDRCEGEPFLTRFAKLYAQSEEINSNLDIMLMRDIRLFEFLRHPSLMEALGGLLGPEITCSPIQHLRGKVPTRLTGDQPGYFFNVPWHQDSGVTWEEADASLIVTVWIPLVDATAERGCMRIMPDVFKGGHLPHQREGGTTIRPDLLPKVPELVAEVRAGGAIFMSQFTPHRSTPNTTEFDVRWTMDLRYQRTGTPTGRPGHPHFVAASAARPESVLRDFDQWSRMWVDALEEQARNPQQMHRV